MLTHLLLTLEKALEMCEPLRCECVWSGGAEGYGKA